MEEILCDTEELTDSRRSSRRAQAKLHDHQRNLAKRKKKFKALKEDCVKNAHGFLSETGTNTVTLTNNSLLSQDHRTHKISVLLLSMRLQRSSLFNVFRRPH